MKSIRYGLIGIFLFGINLQTVAAQSAEMLPEHPLLRFAERYSAIQSANNNRAKANEDAQLESREEQIWEGEEYIPAGLFENIYEGNLRTEESMSAWNPSSEDWMEIESVLYDHENGNLVTITEQSFSGLSLENEYRTVLEYDEGQSPWVLVSVIEQIWENGDWVNDYKSDLSFSNGIVESIISFEWAGEQWVEDELVELTESDGASQLTYSIYINGDWEPETRDIFPDFTLNEFIELITSQYNFIETGSFLSLFDRLPDFTEQELIEGDWVDMFRQVSEEVFDADNSLTERVIRSQNYDLENEDWISDLEIVISYNNQVVEESVIYVPTEESESGEFMAIFAEEFTYGSEGLPETILRRGQDMTSMEKEVTGQKNSEHLAPNSRVMLTWSGAVTSTEEPIRPLRYSLANAYPNPFNPSAVIPFEAGESGPVSIKVYDVLGRFVMTLLDENLSAGSHTVRFDGSNLNSGVYMVRLQAPGFQQTKRVTLLK